MGQRGRKSKKQMEEEIQEEEQQPQQQEDSEDYCFVCKDGGLLIVCDYKGCVKAYHADCVGKEESTEEVEDEWICGWHNCLLCKKSSRYQCFCCSTAVCQKCLKDTAFAQVRGNKGFCADCLKLALLGEEGIDVDSDGEKVDFKDRETYEGLFKEYWDIIKEKEGLTLEDLHHADIQIQKGENASRHSHQLHSHKSHSHKSDSDSDEYNKQQENKESSSDDHESDDDIQPTFVKPKKRPRKSQEKRQGSKKIEFVGWASKSLIEFLASIGVDTSKKQSQDDVALLINKYVHDHGLIHPEKKKVVLCDVRLRSILGRRSISIYKIDDALEAHFPENLEQSEDEGYSSGYEENNVSQPAKKQAWWRKEGPFQHKGSLLDKFQQKVVSDEPAKTDVVVKVQYSCYASIVLKNMKMVYLRRSLVEHLLGQHETFETKIVGSFVKVKSDPIDSKHPYQLLPVTGIKKTSGDEDNRNVLLQVSNLPNDVPVRLLSNDDLSEEDCEALRQKVVNGLLEKLTVVELEKKAKDLHEDITKHWITKELSILRRRIDLANEKGRRAELYEYLRKRDLLQSEEEQSRLLKEVPEVIADVIESKATSGEPQQNNNGKNVS